MKKLGMLFGVAAATLSSAALGAVYVDVETEGGTFTIEMDAGAKNGGAAFLGLAEGWVDWVDPRNGEPRHGARYYEGTSMGWVQRDGGGEALLVGNVGRRFTGTDGERNWNNGAGVEFPDDIAGPTGLTARSVAMVQQEGPHSIDGDWAVLLKDADEYYGGHWSRVGTVVSNWGVVEAMAGRAVDENGWMEEPVVVTGMRVHGDAGEIAARKAVAEAISPACGLGEAGLEVAEESGTLHCRMDGMGRYAIAHTTNLPDPVWSVDWMDWNEGGEPLEAALPFSTDEAAMGKQRFFAVPTVEYPELGGPKVEGTYSFRVEWEMGAAGDNQVYHYDLDVGAGTGMVYQLDLATQSTVLRSAACNQFQVGRAGAHSRGVRVVISDWWQVPLYWLGEEKAGDGRGRFRMWEMVTGGEAWGPWEGRGGRGE